MENGLRIEIEEKNIPKYKKKVFVLLSNYTN